MHKYKWVKTQSGYIDLYKDKKGNIICKPKSGCGPGEPTGYISMIFYN
jgi:hypothetical protein